MRPAARIGASALLAIACCQPAVSEVRLEPRGNRGAAFVRINDTGHGPWTPVGRVDARTLNPDGDLLGDGRPAVALAPDGAEVLVAWPSPARGGLRYALGSVEWNSEREVHGIEGDRAEAVAVGTGYVVLGGEAELRVAVVRPGLDDVLIPAELSQASGALLAAAVVGDTLHVIVKTQSGSLDAHAFHVIIDDNPIIFRKIGVVTLGSASGTVTVVEARLPRDQQASLLTWWPSPGTLSVARLPESSVVFDIRTFEAEGPRSETAVLRAALRSFTN